MADIIEQALSGKGEREEGEDDAFHEFLFGKEGKMGKASTLSKDQKELVKLINEGLIKGDGPFKDLFGSFNQEEFKKGVADPALKQFQEEVLPMIQEKYVANNQSGGSGMRRGLLKAGTNFQSQLAKLLYEAQQGHKQNKLAGIQTGLGKEAVKPFYQPGTQGVAQSFVGAVGEGVGKGIGQKIAG